MSLHACQLACMRGDRVLFEGLDVRVEPGDALRVCGPNGSGKTSLLRLLAGLACPAAGAVRWDGRDIRALREQFCARLVYLGHAPGVKDDLLAWENVVIGAALAGLPASRDAACAALAELGLEHACELPVRVLSQGQRKRVALARLQLAAPAGQLWILDEPFAALDVAAVDALAATLQGHLARGGMLVYTTHQEVALPGARRRRLELGGRAAVADARQQRAAEAAC